MRFLVVTLCAVFISLPVMAKDLVLVADEWCPYNCKPGSDRPGYMIEIARAAFTPQGHRVIYQTLNWARAVAETRQGRFDAVVGAFQGDAPDFVFPDEPLGQSGNALFVTAASEWRYLGPESLRGMRIGIIRSYDYGDLIARLLSHAELDMVSGDNGLATNIKKLRLGRIDGFIEDISVALFRLEAMGLRSDIVPLPGVVDYEDAYIAFSPALNGADYYGRALSQAVVRMRRDGRLQAILGRYGLEDWQNRQRSPTTVGPN